MWKIIELFVKGEISFEEALERANNLTFEEVRVEANDMLLNIKYLDEYDFSEFLGDGRSFWNFINAIEEKYDKEFYQKHNMYMFDNLDDEDIRFYFSTRYTIRFQEYIDWVVRHEDGPYSKARRRIEDSAGTLA